MSSAAELATHDPLERSVQYVRGVGPRRAECLRRLDVVTVRDLLYLLPRDYEAFGRVCSIASLTPDLQQTVLGEVVDIEVRSTASGKSVLSVTISDGRYIVEGVWFNQPFRAKDFRYGQQVAFSGKPRWHGQHWQIVNPIVRRPEEVTEQQSARLLPIYPLTEGITQQALRYAMQNALQAYGPSVGDILPAQLRTQRGLPDVATALYQVHFPETLAQAQQARRRLVYEELFVLQVALALKKRENQAVQNAPVMKVTPTIDRRIRQLFGFDLTPDQNRAVAHIVADLARPVPMRRLLQADVGAGKTAVAVYALLTAIAYKYQAALLAPTEVLARQHWHTLNRYLAKSRVRRLLLTGNLSAARRKEALVAIAKGEVDLVVGTQAIIQKDVQFARLGLVVIDEQHRFGVLQRAQVCKLNASGQEPHYLVMTATPIPRTVALTVFGDLDVTTMRRPPPGRHPVRTQLVPEAERSRLYEYLCQEIHKGRQLFIVCPLVSETESQDVRAAEQTYDMLRTGPFSTIRLGLLHGRMSDETKEEIMQRFRRGTLDALVTTSVIEVGIDVPRATLMVIEQAERFGLSQLPQLRGRISRGSVAGECYLFSNAHTPEAEQRLALFCRIQDGFQLAEEDARLRGIGEFFGTRQHGPGELRIADGLADVDLLVQAREDAQTLVREDPALRQAEHHLVRREVLRRYGARLHLAQIG